MTATMCVETSRATEDAPKTAKTPIERAQRTCLTCGAVGVANRCGGCRRVYFCGRDCQREAWPTHRPICLSTASQEKKTTDETHSASSVEAIKRNDQTESMPIDDDAKLSEQPCGSDKLKRTKVTIDPRPIQRETGAGGLDNRKKPPCSGSIQDEPQPTCVSDKADEVSQGKAKEKKKNKKKQKKKRSSSVHIPRSAPLAEPLKTRSISLGSKRNVTWGDVHARHFARLPGGGGAVPYEGSWALGLGRRVEDVQLGSVVEVEEWRQEELKARIKDLPKSKRGNVREGETRQFDYRRGVSNPLFSRLTERERKKLFMKNDKSQNAEKPGNRTKRQLSVSSSSSTASEGEDDEEYPKQDFGCLSMEQLDEFAKIRDSRDSSCGCSCGDLVKKVSKMNVKKLHAFLADRDIQPKGHSKPELTALAKAVAMQEKNCSNQKDCECARNGIPCHQLACVGCANDCHNPHQTYQYNRTEVAKYRQQLLAKWKDRSMHSVADPTCARAE